MAETDNQSAASDGGASGRFPELREIIGGWFGILPFLIWLGFILVVSAETRHGHDKKQAALLKESCQLVAIATAAASPSPTSTPTGTPTATPTPTSGAIPKAPSAGAPR